MGAPCGGRVIGDGVVTVGPKHWAGGPWTQTVLIETVLFHLIQFKHYSFLLFNPTFIILTITTILTIQTIPDSPDWWWCFDDGMPFPN